MKSIYVRLLRYVRPELPSLLLAFVCMIVLAAATSFYAFLAGPALNFVFGGDAKSVLLRKSGKLHRLWTVLPDAWLDYLQNLKPHQALYLVPALIIITALVKGIAQTGQFFLMGRISQRALQTLRVDTFSAMVRQPPAFFTSRTQGDLVSRLTADATLIEQAFFYGLGPILRDTLALLALVVFCFSTDLTLALVTFVLLPLAVVPLARFAKRLKRASSHGQAAAGALSAASYEALSGIRVVQAFGNEHLEIEKISKVGLGYLTHALKSYFIRAVRTPTMEVLGAIALAGLLGFLGYRVQEQGADPGRYISFFAAIVMMYDPIKKLGSVGDYFATGIAAAERVFEILDTAPTICDAPDATELLGFQHTVAFNHVQFAYNDSAVLRDVDLQIQRGQMVALVGASGSGKTTLAHLLPRFYDVTGGSITLDGKDIRSLTLASLRKHLSLVSQDTFLFNATVEENIAYGHPTATHDAILAAAKAAYADEFIVNLPQGYNTVVGERGVMLSGGQRQRLAIARALLRNAPLLILDEATSSLDIESERYVQRALDVLLKGRTSLVIAHRLSTIRHADVIAVVKDGCIVERGRHEELLAKGGEYARLFALQFAEPVQLVS